jgi:hypothetical protein
MNYRNIGLGFSIAILMEMKKELIESSTQYRYISEAEEKLVRVLNGLPDELYEDEVERSTLVFFEMEKQILREKEYSKLLNPLEQDQLYELITPGENCGTDYL